MSREDIISPIKISLEAFSIPRTPTGLSLYKDSAYEYICSQSEMVKDARLHKEPFKTFAEELLPFTAYCYWKYGKREDILCSLIPGNQAGDGLVKDLGRGTENLIEITWPVDGKYDRLQAKQMNEQGFSDCKVWSDDDVTEHKKAITRLIEKAKEKALKNYYSLKGDSTLILVFDEFPLFWKDNPHHVTLLENLVSESQHIDYLVDDVILMLMPNKDIRVIKEKHARVNKSCSSGK